MEHETKVNIDSGRVNCTTVSNYTAGDKWFLAVHIENPQLTGIFGGIYHSASSSNRVFLDNFENWLQNVITDDKINVISGDFNSSWNSGGYTTELKNIADAAGMDQKALEYTRITDRSRTIIDLVFANVEGCTVDWFKPGDLLEPPPKINEPRGYIPNLSSSSTTGAPPPRA